MTGKKNAGFIVFLLALLCVSCSGKEKTGKLNLKFTFSVDGEALRTQERIYTNAAGNSYEVDEVKYFISDITLLSEELGNYSVRNKNSIHYVDSDIPSTLGWSIGDPLPAGHYDGIRFTFGLSQDKNTSHLFPNPPESNMAWPSVLGGGYHYMQINGKWDHQGAITPFNLHTGIGQVYSTDSVVRYVHNHFTVTIPNSSFTVEKDKIATLVLDMNINNWFSDPQVFDLDIWGGSIMQNQNAQLVLKQNGWNVFSVKR